MIQLRALLLVLSFNHIWLNDALTRNKSNPDKGVASFKIKPLDMPLKGVQGERNEANHESRCET